MSNLFQPKILDFSYNNIAQRPVKVNKEYVTDNKGLMTSDLGFMKMFSLTPALRIDIIRVP